VQSRGGFQLIFRSQAASGFKCGPRRFLSRSNGQQLPWFLIATWECSLQALKVRDLATRAWTRTDYCFAGPLIYGFGACSWVDESLQESCNNQSLTLQDVTGTAQHTTYTSIHLKESTIMRVCVIAALSIATIEEWDRRVPYAFIQSKADAVQVNMLHSQPKVYMHSHRLQISFYVAIGALDPSAPANITTEEFYKQV
jgi:hypothetical protein